MGSMPVPISTPIAMFGAISSLSALRDWADWVSPGGSFTVMGPASMGAVLWSPWLDACTFVWTCDEYWFAPCFKTTRELDVWVTGSIEGESSEP